MRTSKLTDIYIEAARRIHTYKEEFSCCAVSLAVMGDENQYDDTARERVKYAEVMSPRDGGKLRISDVDDHNDREGAVGFRVWLLCMMAACCEDV